MSDQGGASTFTKGLQVLSCFETSQRSFTMAEVSKRTGFDRATTRRLCLSLVETGFLMKVDQNLSLTPRILAIAGGYLSSNDIGLSVQPVLDQFASELKNEISLVVRDGDRAIYVAKSKVAEPRLVFGFTVGSTLPLQHTAIGRMILAQCKPETIEGIMERVPPRKFTENTEMNPQNIRRALEDGARNGFCYVESEFETGAAAIAVPTGLMNGVESGVGVTNSTNKLQDKNERERTLDVLRQTAMSLRRISIFT